NIVQISTSNSTGISNLFTLETKPFVFPNPASEKIHIANNNGLPDNKPCTVIIKNIEGKTIQKTETMLTSEIIIPFENENSGVYTYEITRDNLLIQKSSFIINK
ncbi:MAG TPA: T9SS type A sorting domain-containing protein, partial [Bacteroidia bacterium]|nr:T9SS type A sorting domain-containing protein [Bacteroidia bacterium]